METRLRSPSPSKRPPAKTRPSPPKSRASPLKPTRPKQRSATRSAAAGGWLLLISIAAVASYSQLRVAGVLPGVGADTSTEGRQGLLPGGAGHGRHRHHGQSDYRRLHSHEATVAPEELQCHGLLTPETARLLAPQLREERAAMEEAAAGARPLPPFLAARDGGVKRCRASPKGSKRPPRLHRVALFTPQDGTGLAWASEAAPGLRRARRLLWQHRREQQVRLAGAGAAGAAAAGGDITLVTQLSIDRLGSLEQQCASWRGPTAAVVYAPLVRGRLAGLAGSPDAGAAALEGGTPLDALRHVRRAYERVSALQGACQLSLELVVEERCNAHLAALWPINANRNRALMLAASPAVLLADVDFVVGGELSPWLRGAPADATAAQRWRQLLAAKQAAVGLNGGSRGGSGGGTYPGLDVDMSDAGIAAGLAALAAAHAGSKNSSRDDAWLAGVLAAAQREGVSWLEAVLASDGAVVLPAFQPTTGASRRELRAGAALALAAARGDKRRLAALAVAQPPRMAGFQQDKYPRGHRATRYWWWLQARQPYAVDYWQGYEPFLLMATAATPLYDERFRGYGWDKHVHTLQLARQAGARLVVHPDAWLVHLPHPRSAAMAASHATGQRLRLHALFADARRRILNHRFTPTSAYWRLCARPASADGAARWEAAAAREAARLRREEEAVLAAGEGYSGDGATSATEAEDGPWGEQDAPWGAEDGADDASEAADVSGAANASDPAAQQQRHWQPQLEEDDGGGAEPLEAEAEAEEADDSWAEPQEQPQPLQHAVLRPAADDDDAEAAEDAVVLDE